MLRKKKVASPPYCVRMTNQNYLGLHIKKRVCKRMSSTDMVTTKPMDTFMTSNSDVKVRNKKRLTAMF